MSYQPIELGQPGHPPIPDQFDSSSELLCKGCGKVILQISLEGVFIQFGAINVGGSKAGALGNAVWGPEEPYLPLTAALNRRFDAVRVRNYIAGKAGQILLTPIQEGA